ncbi:MAG: hypothetical protein ACLGSH_12390 [Acidobacteriota bacterium]
MAFVRMDQEIQEIGALFEECARSSDGCVVLHKPTVNDGPYRWELHKRGSAGWFGTISLDGSDIHRMMVMSESDRRAFLCSKFNDAFAMGTSMQ